MFSDIAFNNNGYSNYHYCDFAMGKSTGHGRDTWFQSITLWLTGGNLGQVTSSPYSHIPQT